MGPFGMGEIRVSRAGAGRASPAGAGPGKDSLTLCQTLEPPILDPTAGAAAAIREVVTGNVFEGLVAYDRDGKWCRLWRAPGQARMMA